jgi:triphosphoribosyl-dephospho-CoA synthase
MNTTDHAQLALLLEVAGTPKPGNVDREREYPDLRFEHFLAGAVGARSGLALAAEGGAVGEAFERAVAGMSHQSGGNTQFGAVLLVTPLVRAAGTGALSPASARAVVAETTVADAVGFYRAFEHVGVAVDDPPAGEDGLPDVRRGGEAAPELRERELTLAEVMADSADVDGIAAEYDRGFPRTFETAERIVAGEGPVVERAADAYLHALAAEVDTFVVTQHDRETAEWVRERAAEIRGAVDRVRFGESGPVARFARRLVDRGINPGTTADLVAGGLFVALERGLEV